MADNFNEQDFFDIFQKKLPPEPLPPETAARIEKRVMEEVAFLRASVRVEESTRTTNQTVTSGQAAPRLQPRVVRPTVSRDNGLWSRLLNSLRNSLSLAPSFTFAMATVAVVLLVVLYGPSSSGSLIRLRLSLGSKPQKGLTRCRRLRKLSRRRQKS